MIKKISIIQYRKLKNLVLTFSSGITFISGANGTCKSSLLHMISNAFQSVVSATSGLKDKNCLSIIKSINAGVNQKIEALTRDAKVYKDPAAEVKGTLFTIQYSDEKQLSFRKHNSKIAERFAVKPHYAKGTHEKLPAIPVIYLGLSRLFPVGEFQNDENIEKIKQKLPESYRKELKDLYNRLTHIEIDVLQPQRMKGVKVRNDFTTQHNGVDGNTISSGEDNVFIILTALFSLKYYYDSLPVSTREIESILLVDEFDATLHPSLQERLLDTIRDFSKLYKIQFISTTHSLSLLEYSLQRKDKIIYLCDNIDSVTEMSNPDIAKIKMRLKTLSREKIYADKKIPVFTEDEEARLFLNYYMDYLQERDSGFKFIRSCFHFVNASIGAECLRDMFADLSLASSMNAICILDGDKTEKHSGNIIAMPGKKSPERLIFDYAEELFQNNDDFWTLAEVDRGGYDRAYYRETIQQPYKAILTKHQEKVEKGEGYKGELRKELKNLWNENLTFVSLLIRHWLNNPQNHDALFAFTDQLNVMFMKTAEYHGISKQEWIIKHEAKNV